MKKYVLASLALLSCYSASAQSGQVLSGDFTGDGGITVADVTYMTDIILGKREPVYVTVPSVTTSLLLKRQAFVDETGTFPVFRFSQGQYVNLRGVRDGRASGMGVELLTVEDDGLSAYSDGGLFSLRQDDTQYVISGGDNDYSIIDGKCYVNCDFHREQWYYGNEKRISDDCNFYLSQPVSFEDGVATFDLYNLNAMVRLSLSGLAPGANVGYIDLENDESVFMGRRYAAVTAEGVQLSDRESYNVQRLRLNTPDCTADSEGNLDVYMMMGAIDLSGKEFRIKAYVNDVPFTTTVSGQNMEMNHCYTYAASGFAMEGNIVAVGSNAVNYGEYIFVPEESGYYDITCDTGCDIYAPMSMAGGYQVQAGNPYRIYVYGDGNLNIEKKVFEAFELGTAKSVTSGTYYELTIPAAGYYHLTSANGNNRVWGERFGDYYFPTWPDYAYLEAGTGLVYFDYDDEVSISALTSIAVGTANAVEAETYYTFAVEEDGFYTFTSDVENHVNIWGDEIDTGGDTPQRYYMCPNEREHRIRVQNAGTLTITLEDTPVIELGAETPVIASHGDHRDAMVYKFVATERGLYNIQGLEGCGIEIIGRGDNTHPILDPGTYFIYFYQWDRYEDKNITVNISKLEAAETLSLDAENTVQLSTPENPIYYRFQTGSEGALYYLHPGAGCSLEVTDRGQERFMNFGENEEHYVRFWSNTGDPSVTTTTFSISKTEVVDMPLGETVEVAANKLYLVRSGEDAEYFFSVAAGCHVRRLDWQCDIEDQKHNMNWEEWTIYFYSNTEDIATTTAQVKKVEYVAMPYNEETTVLFDGTCYTFEITEYDQYAIYVGDGCSYDVEGYGSSFDWLYPGTYRVSFRNNGNPSLTSTTAKVGKMADVAPAFTLGTEVTANAGMWYKLEVTEDDQYVFSTDAAWYVVFNGWGEFYPGSSLGLSAGTYYIRFNKQYEEAASSANVTFAKAADVAQTIELGSTFLPVENMWYKLVVEEQDIYSITRTGDWTYDIQNVGNPGNAVTLEPNTYLIHFWREWWSSEEGNVTIAKAADVAQTIELGSTFLPVENVLYKLVVDEQEIYRITRTGDWNYDILGVGNPGELITLEPNTYFIRFWREWWSGEEGNVTVGKFADKEITLNATDKITVNNSEQWYKLSIPETGAYEFTTDNWTYEIYERGYLGEIASLTVGNYYVRFYPAYDGADASASVQITSYETAAITLGESFEVNDPEQYFTLVLTEDTFYEFNNGEGWSCGYNGTTYLGAGAYTLRFENYDGNYASANVNISKAVLPVITLGEEFEVTEEYKPYILNFEEEDWYSFNLSEGWTYDVIWHGYFGEMTYRGNESYYITFNRMDESAPATAHVTISKGVEQVELSLGDNSTTRGKLYTFRATEPGFYTFGTSNGWMSSVNTDHYATVAEGQIIYMYEDSQVTFAGTDMNMSVIKESELPYYGVAVLGEKMHYESGQVYKVEITEEGYYRMASNEVSGMWWDIRDINNNQNTLSDSDPCWLTPGTYYTTCYNDNNITIYKE